MQMKDLGTQTQQGYVRMKYILSMEVVKPLVGYVVTAHCSLNVI
jgi:general stress protein CsbA